MAGGVIHGTADTTRIESPVTLKAYLMCAFAAFGGIFFGYDTGWMGGIMGMKSVCSFEEAWPSQMVFESLIEL
jgi:hypothetical protein